MSFFFFVSLHRTIVYILYNTHRAATVSPAGGKRTGVAQVSYTNIQYFLINTGGDSHSNTYILSHKWKDGHIRFNASQHGLIMYKELHLKKKKKQNIQEPSSAILQIKHLVLSPAFENTERNKISSPHIRYSGVGGLIA